MLISAERIVAEVRDEDILTIHTLGGRVIRGHWYEDRIMEQLCFAASFTKVGPMEYRRNDVY